MYPPHLAKGCRLNDCDATTWYAEKVEAASKGLPTWKHNSFAAHRALPRKQLWQLVRYFPCDVRSPFTLRLGCEESICSQPAQG